jgi:hypothetical protein
VGLHRLYSCPPGRSVMVSHPRDTYVPCSDLKAGKVVRRRESVVLTGKVEATSSPRADRFTSAHRLPVSLLGRLYTVLYAWLPDPALGMGNRAKAGSSRKTHAVTSRGITVCCKGGQAWCCVLYVAAQ